MRRSWILWSELIPSRNRLGFRDSRLQADDSVKPGVKHRDTPGFMIPPAPQAELQIAKRLLAAGNLLSVRVVNFNRPILPEDLACLRGITDRDNLQMAQVDIFIRYALNVFGRDRHNALRVSVPLIGRQVIKLLGDYILQQLIWLLQ